MAWLAQGSDVGGSLRNPASFCGVTGMRPSIGRVAKSPGAEIDATLSVEGPMARNVDDLALFLDALSGEDVRLLDQIGCREVYVAELEPGDLGEDPAAVRMAAAGSEQRIGCSQ